MKRKQLIITIALAMSLSCSAVAAEFSPTWWTGTHDMTNNNPNGVWQLDQFGNTSTSPADMTPDDFTRMKFYSSATFPKWASSPSGHPVAFQSDTAGALALSFVANGSGSVSRSGAWSSLTFVAPEANEYKIAGAIDFYRYDTTTVMQDGFLDVTIFKFNDATSQWTKSDVATFWTGTGTNSVALEAGGSQLYDGNADFFDGVQLNAGDYVTVRPWTASRNGGVAFQADMDKLQVTSVPEPATMILLGVGAVLGMSRRKRS